MMHVFAFPPKLDRSSLVKLEFLYGIWPSQLPFLYSANLLITQHKQKREVLMCRPSFSSVSNLLFFIIVGGFFTLSEGFFTGSEFMTVSKGLTISARFATRSLPARSTKLSSEVVVISFSLSSEPYSLSLSDSFSSRRRSFISFVDIVVIQLRFKRKIV